LLQYACINYARGLRHKPVKQARFFSRRRNQRHTENASSRGWQLPDSLIVFTTAATDVVGGRAADPQNNPRATAQKRLVRALALLYVLLACSLSVSAALPEVRRTIAMSDVVTSLHSSFFGWSLIIGGLFSARLFRRLGHGRVLAAGTVAMTGGAVTFGLGHHAWATLTGAAAFGAGAAAVVITIPAVVAAEFRERRNEVFTRLNAAPVFGGAMFTLSLAAAASRNIWRLPVIAIPLGVGLITAVVGLRLRGTNIGVAETLDFQVDANATASHSPIGLLRHNVAFRNRWLMLVVSITAEFDFGAWMVTFVRENGGFSSGRAPLVGVMWGGGMIVSRTMTPRILRVLGRRVESTLFLVMAAGVAATILTPSFAGRLLAVGLTGFAVGPLYPLGIERLFVRAHGQDVTAVSSAGALASGVGATFGPLIIGFFSDRFELPRAMWIPAALALFGAFAAKRRWGNEAGELGSPHDDGIFADLNESVLTSHS
jgi:MFS family permease